MDIPTVEKARLWTQEEGSDRDFPWGSALESRLGDWQEKRILVILKKSIGLSLPKM